jgi:hypothetical protein
MTTHALRNLLTAPAGDDVLVDAVLAFVNGDEVVVCGQPTERGAAYTEPHSHAEVRGAYIGLLQRFIDDPSSLLPTFGDGSGRRPVFAVVRLAALDEAMCPSGFPKDFFRHVASVVPEEILVGRPGGYSPRTFWRFRDAESALATGALRLLDPDRPYSKALRRCVNCKHFYLAKRNPKGGPANRIYCSPPCRRDANEAARSERRVREEARKHK